MQSKNNDTQCPTSQTCTKTSIDSSWSVYIIKASDDRLYTGITNNISARWIKHSTNKGAKFFRGRKPIALCYHEPDHSRSSASRREYQIKQFNRQQKQQLIIKHYGPFKRTPRNHLSE